MAQSNGLLKIFNVIFPVVDFMYILQQEEYISHRLWKWLPRFFWRRNFQVRDHLKYTQRVKITLCVIISLWLLSLATVVSLGLSLVLSTVFVVIWSILTPLFVLLGNVLVTPYFERIKLGIRRQAAEKVSQTPDLKVVLVAGSYGKTTTKNFIYQLTQYNYRTQMIPGNINTPAGIANWVNSNLEKNTELLIGEVDAYEVGEVARSCEVLQADVAVLTNIGDQHLERFKNEAILAEALSEVFTKSKPKAYLLTTQQTKNKLSINVGSREWVIVEPLSDVHEGLSASNQINLQFALTTARLLGVPEKFIQDTMDKLELPDRRQKQTEMFGYQAVDDSYNISFTTAQAGIKAAKNEATKQGKKLLVITAGIPELAPDRYHQNRELGRLLSQNADQVVVLGSMFAKEVYAGINEQTKCITVPDLNIFLTEVKSNFPAGEWFLLMQPELNDLYY